MIDVFTEQYGGIEVLHAAPAGCQDKPLPTVIFYHGFTSSKLVYSYFGVSLALAGFRVIMPDAPEHGARFQGDENARLTHFWQILHQSMTEYPALRDGLREKGLIDGDLLGVGGASMGAMTALGIMARHPEVHCVASLMGSGYYHSLAKILFPPLAIFSREDQAEFDSVLAHLKPYEASQHLVALARRPLLLWHGLEDDVVPAAESLRLQQTLEEEGMASQLTCVWEAGVKHRITPLGLDSTVAFFRQHLVNE